MTPNQLTYDSIKSAIIKAGFKFFTGNFNINMVGIRTNTQLANNYDDYFCILYQEKGVNKIWVNSNFTTDPGIYYLQKKLLNPKGCGILARGQYRGLWTIGKHGSKQYEAFVQTGAPVNCYRDRNMNNVLDFDPATLESGFFGCNQHHGYDTKTVDNNSAMCQVHRFKKDLGTSLYLAKQNILNGNGDSFTYTLLEEKVDF